MAFQATIPLGIGSDEQTSLPACCYSSFTYLSSGSYE